ncbi:MAG TPA: hypothetical protein VJQ54_22460 [Candidatus Sulfotelmatobacter sp.]|nr:hypothetical protein [Candidatus Sulfotelmatobacter sp.]
METLALVLKVIGIVVAGILGYVGTRHDFKNSAGRLTKWGRWTITGIFVSTGIALSVQLFEHYLVTVSSRDASLKAAHTSAQLATVVSELSRGLQVFDKIEMFLILEVPVADPLLQRYKTRLDKGAAEQIERDRSTDFTRSTAPQVTYSLKRYNDGPLTVDRVSFGPENKMSPTEADGPCSMPLLSVDIANIQLFRQPTDSTKLYGHAQAKKPDIYATLRDSALWIGVDPVEGKYELSGRLSASRNSWDNYSERIVATSDLDGAQLFLHVGYLDDSKCTDFIRLKAQYNLKYVSVRFGARQLAIEGKQFIKHVSSSGDVYWEYRFRSPAFARL